MMKKVAQAIVVAAGCTSLCACATVVRGTNTTWNVATMPSGAVVDTTSGLHCSSTPCSLRVPRLAEFTATVSKPGFEPADVRVTHSISGSGAAVMAGNVIVGGVPGVVIDLLTGAVDDVAPNDVALTLKPSRFAPDPYAVMSPAAALTAADLPPPAAPTATLAEGRVIDFKLLSNGEVQEMRARPY